MKPPWQVREAAARPTAGEVVIEVECGDDGLVCPDCGARSPLHDERRRRFQHLDLMGYRTTVRVKRPRGSAAPNTESAPSPPTCPPSRPPPTRRARRSPAGAAEVTAPPTGGGGPRATERAAYGDSSAARLIVRTALATANPAKVSPVSRRKHRGLVQPAERFLRGASRIGSDPRHVRLP